ncbi:ABC transporter ATP-binding protein [Selenomonas sp. TAMA-11512]|uniref:ABC transporter ATP-binding protein n=1 Tax=Selenomonas sp. TAMA-11512 TaxID=3095337 RepID=UPI00308B772A|nr:ABC transporter ATP-binding protein [Selenomonas sp. TAMA-11512]
MIDALRKIWAFAGSERKNLNRSVLLGVLYAMFHALQLAALYVVLKGLVEHADGPETAVQALAILAVGILGKSVIEYVSQLQRVHAGYFMAANKRIAIGDRLKRVPMGYFNETSLGRITGVATTVLGDVEETASRVLVRTLTGFLNTIILIPMLLVFDWRIGAVFLAGIAVYLYITAAMEAKSRRLAPKRQEAQAALVEAVLEQLHGMHVIKAFNLTGRGDRRVRGAIAGSERANLAMERLFTPYTVAQEVTLRLFSVLIIAAAIYAYLAGTMALPDAIMCIVFSFIAYEQLESAGSALALLRVVCASIDEANATDDVPQLDEDGRAIVPTHHGITFDRVSFAYGEKPILTDIFADIPERSLTAIVGPSGSGKTTMCHLIARFWDVDAGTISIGGHDVKEYTLESLMAMISIVFQRVYLFRDTIENNIRFGRPQASREEVIEAAKKAACHDFIMQLPDGYETIVGEGGANLSGGERQRISIARAILKDAPVIIFDEATANVDPENEDRLQQAIEALTRDKTVIMIAHRLKTVRNAAQILVVANGGIVQRGTHDELVSEGGIYADFIAARKRAVGWRLSSPADKGA